MTNPKQYFVEVFDKHGARRKTLGGPNKKELEKHAERQAATQDAFRPHMAPHSIGPITE